MTQKIFYFVFLITAATFVIFDVAEFCEVPNFNFTETNVNWTCHPFNESATTMEEGTFCISECDLHKTEHTCQNGEWDVPSE